MKERYSTDLNKATVEELSKAAASTGMSEAEIIEKAIKDYWIKNSGDDDFVNDLLNKLDKVQSLIVGKSDENVREIIQKDLRGVPIKFLEELAKCLLNKGDEKTYKAKTRETIKNIFDEKKVSENGISKIQSATILLIDSYHGVGSEEQEETPRWVQTC